MCLLVTQPEGVVFNDDFLRGVFDRNSDGVGVMYAKDNVLHSVKMVPVTFDDFKRFYDEHISTRACAWHARYKTHGDVNLDQCHPYEVLGEDTGYPLYLAHNGVLTTGNAKDKSKSDTHHFINDFLRPMLKDNPSYFMHPSFSELIGDFIGVGNKFVLLDAYGNMVTVNESEFVTYNGAKLSNTYAWDVTGTEHDWKRKPYKGYISAGGYTGHSYSNGFNNDLWDDDLNLSYGHRGTVVARPDTEEEPVGKYVAPTKPTIKPLSYLPTVWEDADAQEAQDFADYLFSELKSLGYEHAYKAITLQSAQNYYLALGPDAWDLCEMLERSGEDEIMDEIAYTVAQYDQEMREAA